MSSPRSRQESGCRGTAPASPSPFGGATASTTQTGAGSVRGVIVKTRLTYSRSNTARNAKRQKIDANVPTSYSPSTGTSKRW